ncbi:MAG: hypothetical protein FVQ85_05210 [Planctomycetes bacterium]|nr:hypothetical protein [Planctomycetota bacterium]
MTTTPVITGYLNGIFPALTPVEIWKAAGEYNSSFMTQRWFILIGIIFIITLTVLLLLVSFNRSRQERNSSDQLFIEFAEKRGLTVRERQILIGIAYKAGLRRSESIFTMVTGFDRGVAKMIEESLTDLQATEESKQLKTELSFLREKLGFKKRQFMSAGSSAKLAKFSSRQIPVGKKVHITRRQTPDSGEIESTVVKNTDNELSFQLTETVKITFGEFWCVRYYFGSSVWEFDASVVSYDGNILVLNHNDNVRFINRRRFLRVQVKMPAFIACFPFEKSSIENSHISKNEFGVDHDLVETSAATWGPPEFVPAVVTELAGPGLRIESELEVKTGERILVVFSLEQEQDSVPANRGKDPTVLKIVEDIGKVRHTKSIHNGMSIAVELTGLSDSDTNELIRATNAALLSVSDRKKNVPTSGGTSELVSEYMGV